MRFVVIGGDAAGMSAASRAKRLDSGMDVVVLEQSADVSYSACGMPYNIADPERSIEDLVVRNAEVFREKQNIDLRLGHRAESIDRKAGKVFGTASSGKKFEVSYDKLLIATGARPISLDVPGGDAAGVLYLKTLQDGRGIKDYLAENTVKKVLIVGTGYIGLEMAESFRARGLDVVMIEALPRLLPWMPQDMAAPVGSELKKNGVALHLQRTVTRIDRRGDAFNVFLDSAEEIAADMVLVAIGVRPNSEMAAAAGLALGPRDSIAVDRTLRTSDPDIFAAGDCADAFHIVTDDRVWIPLALRANRAGWAVADNVANKETALPGIAGSAVFKVFDLEVARTGLSLEEARTAGFNPVESYVKSRSRAHAHPGNQTVHVSLVGDTKSGELLGCSMVGREGVAHRIDSVAVALHAHMTVEDFAQCDLAYAPPFSPVWDPLLTAANQLLKGLG